MNQSGERLFESIRDALRNESAELRDANRRKIGLGFAMGFSRRGELDSRIFASVAAATRQNGEENVGARRPRTCGRALAADAIHILICCHAIFPPLPEETYTRGADS